MQPPWGLAATAIVILVAHITGNVALRVVRHFCHDVSVRIGWEAKGLAVEKWLNQRVACHMSQQSKPLTGPWH